MSDLSVAVVSVPVKDQTRARDFYRDKLGFTVAIESAMGNNMTWVMLTAPGGGAAITLVTWFESMPAGSLRGLVLEAKDIVAEHARLRAAGVAIDDIKDASWGRFATFRDIDGNDLVLTQSAGQ
jgi:catechol 2,3-dioxygenase-like lactoylglutathione lyase family enzyme